MLGGREGAGCGGFGGSVEGAANGGFRAWKRHSPSHPRGRYKTLYSDSRQRPNCVPWPAPASAQTCHPMLTPLANACSSALKVCPQPFGALWLFWLFSKGNYRVCPSVDITGRYRLSPTPAKYVRGKRGGDCVNFFLSAETLCVRLRERDR